jgi:hypothetical protein
VIQDSIRADPQFSCPDTKSLWWAAWCRQGISADQVIGILRPSLADAISGGLGRQQASSGWMRQSRGFSRWAFSDLRGNTTRGILAEFLVAKAVGDERALRIGWDNSMPRRPMGRRLR